MHLNVDPESLREFVRPIAEEVAAAFGEKHDDDQVTVNEAEAASRLGMQSHQLRDRRLAGEVVGTKLGGRWYYEVDELRDYARRNRVT